MTTPATPDPTQRSNAADRDHFDRGSAGAQVRLRPRVWAWIANGSVRRTGASTTRSSTAEGWRVQFAANTPTSSSADTIVLAYEGALISIVARISSTLKPAIASETRVTS